MIDDIKALKEALEAHTRRLSNGIWSIESGPWIEAVSDPARIARVLERLEAAERDRDHYSMAADAEAKAGDEARARLEAAEMDAERYRWLQERQRWASVSIDFDRDSIYSRHRVSWYSDDGWMATEGQSLDDAVDAAMKKEQT